MSWTTGPTRPSFVAAWIGLGFLCVASFVYAWSAHRTFVDESVHVPQIQYFLDGRWAFHPHLTTIPGYHLVMALLVKLTNVGVDGMRVFGLPFAFLGGWAFYRIRATLGDPTAWRSALLFFFVPALFPYYFLIYTDVLSLALLLCALLASLRHRHLASAAILAAAVLVRQNNVVWAAFMPLLAIWPRVPELLRDPRRVSLQLLPIAAPYLLPALLFAGFWAWNGTISLSRTVAPMHPDLKVHAGNVYFALLLYLILFPMEAWSGLKSFARSARLRPWMILFPLLVMAYAKVKGSPDNYAFTDYFVRNAILESIRHRGWERWAFALATAVAACGLIRTRFLIPQGWLVYVFAAIYLCSSWLIEWRYALVPLAIWMALRQGAPARQEIVSLVAWIALGQFIVWGIFGGHFML